MEALSPAILVVDDDDVVRELTLRILMDAGYRVAAARNGLEALEQLYQACPHLLITDSSMPELGGSELIAEARSRFPDLPILRMSGSFGSTSVRDRLPADVQTLDKPFGAEELLEAVALLIRRID